MSCENFCLGVVALFFPPLPVWIKRGLCTADSVINIALCMLGWLPGVLHAIYIIVTTDDYERIRLDQEDVESGRSNVNVYYVSRETGAPRMRPDRQAQAPAARSQQEGGYGTMNSQAAGSSARGQGDVPPTYNEATQGDNKVQGP